MRTISKRTQYGLKAMLALGRRYGEGPILIATLSKEEAIPLKFLEVILLNLKGRGLLESKKGKGGGYQLRDDPSAITLGSLIRMRLMAVIVVPTRADVNGAHAPGHSP